MNDAQVSIVKDIALYPWQEKTWNQVWADGARLPHAMLFHGAAGIGKTNFARHVAQSLLCEKPATDRRACGVCPSCLWFNEGNHPDFRTVRPEILDAAEYRELKADSDFAEGEGGDDIAPASDKPQRRAPSKEIRIDQVAALADFLNLGTHRGGRRVVLVYPLRAMNIYAANALLKMLEEPPGHTVFLLVSDGLDRIVPTLLSRCRHVRMETPQADVALGWLIAQGIESRAADDALTENGGMPLAALAMLDDKNADVFAARPKLLSYLAAPEKRDPLLVAEQLIACGAETVLGWIQRWIFDCISYSETRRIRYYPNEEKQIAAVVAAPVGRAVISGMWAYDKELKRARRVVRHPLNARLFIENLLLRYAETVCRR